MENVSKKYSSYWFDESYYDNYYRGNDSLSRLMKMSAFMRNTANFIRILTGRDIPVQYISGDSSATDFSKVYLNADAYCKFDFSVGVALHEASHILLTDPEHWYAPFKDKEYFRQYITAGIYNLARQLDGFSQLEEISYVHNIKYSAEAEKTAAGYELTFWYETEADVWLGKQFKELVNYIEDRRIDQFIYTYAPGYRGYYKVMYDTYWNSSEISDGLKSDLFRTETVESYMYRIINLTNKETDLSALKGLREISELINISNISRLKNVQQSQQLAANVLSIILRNCTSIDGQKDQNEPAKGKGKGRKGRKFVKRVRRPRRRRNANNQKENVNPSKIPIKSPHEERQIKADELKEAVEKTGLSKKKIKKILDKFNEQKKFLRNEEKKETVDEKTQSSLDAVSKSNASFNTTDVQVKNEDGTFSNQKVNVLMIENLTKSLFDCSEFYGLFYEPKALESEWRSFYKGEFEKQHAAVERGMVLGRVLGKKLQIRNEIKTLKHTRLNRGRIDKRLIFSLGYDNEDVFSKLELDKFIDSNIHITIDASGSMKDIKFNRALTMSMAIVQAASMVKNIEVTVSFRTTMEKNPVVIVAYNSNKHKPGEYRIVAPFIKASGATPESLVFDTLMKKVISKPDRQKKMIFINISDGLPMCNLDDVNGKWFSFKDADAINHCKNTVKKMEQNGFSIISYFVHDDSEEERKGWYYQPPEKIFGDFQKMYGVKNSFHILPEQIEKIAETINEKFLEASNKVVEIV